MALLLFFLVGTQILCSLAGFPPQRHSPPPPPPHFTSPPCNGSQVTAAAELALDKLNKDRREGYVLGLQRIFDVRELQWKETGVVYYLTMDVLETDCHVLSGKSWKDCKFREPYQSVYGQCKATFYINKPWRTLHLFNYDCVLRPLPATTVSRLCPDCPTSDDPTKPKCLEAATLSLAEFNKESNHTHYFKVRNVTRALSQWVVGPATFVEYVIQKTSCSKSQALDDLSECPFLPKETADMGLCKGSVVDSRIENRKFVEAKCEIYHPQVSGGQQTGNRKPGHQDDEESHEDDGHSKGGRKGHHDGHSEGRREGHHDGHSEGRREGQHDSHSEGRREGHRDGHSEGRREGHHDSNSKGRRRGHHDHHHGRHHPHDRHHHHHHHRHHKNDTHDHADHEHDHADHDTFETSTHLENTVGRVTVLPFSNTHVSLHSLPDIEAERLDGAPVPPQSQGPKPNPNLPDIHGAPDENHPLGKPTLIKPARPVTPPPFPAGFSQSDTCPGKLLEPMHGVDHLLPQRPTEAIGTPEFQEKGTVKH